MDFVIWMAHLALNLLLIGVGFWVFKVIMKNGPETLREILTTLDVLIRTGCYKLRRYIAENLRKERKEPEPETAEQAEGSVT